MGTHRAWLQLGEWPGCQRCCGAYRFSTGAAPPAPPPGVTDVQDEAAGGLGSGQEPPPRVTSPRPAPPSAHSLCSLCRLWTSLRPSWSGTNSGSDQTASLRASLADLGAIRLLLLAPHFPATSKACLPSWRCWPPVKPALTDLPHEPPVPAMMPETAPRLKHNPVFS